MSKLLGTKTLENLKKAFFAEAEAHIKYDFYSSKAKKEGFNVISNFFSEASNNEKAHAKIWFKLLNDGDIAITKQNLLDAIKGENYESTIMYQQFAKDALDEGFEDIANLFNMIGNIEKHHCEVYSKFYEKLDSNTLMQSDEPILWICSNCGHLHFGKTPPSECPVCKHPQAYFFKQNQNY